MPATQTRPHSLHVGLLTSDLSPRHGWGMYCLSLARALQAAGVRLTIVASRNTPALDDLDALPLLPSVEPREPRTLPKLLRAVPAVRAALRECDVIHAAVEPFALTAALVAGKRPLFVTGHGSYVRVNRAWGWPVSMFYAWAFRRGTVICVSRYTERAAREAVSGLRTAVVNNGVNAGRFAQLPPLASQKRGLTVLSVGAIKSRKGTLELVRAMARVREHIPDVQCMIIGSLTQEPTYVSLVQAEIKALGLQDSVHLPGYVPDAALLSWYGAADVFVLPSMNAGWKFEGYGLALIEASAVGLPVIGTRDCGAEDAVEDGVTGLLVPQVGIDDALPDAIIRLLRDPELRARMGAAGREKARRQTWDAVAQQMIERYTHD